MGARCFATTETVGTDDAGDRAAPSLKLGRPTVTLMTRGELLEEHNVPVEGIARRVLREQGAALKSDLRLAVTHTACL